MRHRISIGVVAPSSMVPQVELSLGVQKMKDAGWVVYEHPQTLKRSALFAGTDRERAAAFFEYAVHPSFDVLWCARGGYGANRLLPLLERMTIEKGVPSKKLLVGCSDATALLEFARTRWQWSTLHAAMPAGFQFNLLDPADWRATQRLVAAQVVRPAWDRKPLRFFNEQVDFQAVEGVVIGGNLAVLTALMGTPFEPDFEGKMVFLEDIGETVLRIDRMTQQLAQSKTFRGVRAILLGEFTDCEDKVAQVLSVAPSEKARKRVLSEPASKDLVPLRSKLSQKRAFAEIFGALGDALRIPVAYGLPCGHGSRNAPLPLGAPYRLTGEGELQLQSWDWWAHEPEPQIVRPGQELTEEDFA